jgi:hypothetical protein
MIEFIGRSTTCYNISQITIINWALSTSIHNTLLLCNWSQSRPLLYSLRADSTQNYYCCVLYALASIRLFTKNLSLQEHVYQAAA